VNDLVISRRTDWILFVWLLLAGLLGTLIGVPFTIAVLMDPAAGGPVDPRLVWLSALIETLFFLAPASAVGVWLGKKVGLGPRLLRELVSRIPGGWKHLRSILLPTILTGLVLGLLGFSQYLLPEGALGPGLDNPNTFEWVLRCFNAAITEEIFFRLGLLTFFVWVIRLVVKKPALDTPSLWAGNILVAPIFAGSHLPHILVFGSISLNLLIPIVLVSCTASLVMGWLYLRYGLISAIVAHFIVDFVVYVIPRFVTVFA
jgi:membrane protease YdiL (CAAX protease family)